MKKYYPWVILSTIVVVLDLFFKFRVLQNESTLSVISEGGLVSLGLHKNPGIAFNLPVPQPLLWILTLILIGILLHIAWKTHRHNALVATGALVTVIGALGNFIDRVLNNFTTDYLLFFTGTAINLSDVVILTGVLILLFTQKPKGKH